jgi:Zn-dependent protease
MGLINLLFRDPFTFFILSTLLLYSVIAHEVAHGWVALLFGDKTARFAGRLTLNPLKHIDPLGMLLIFIVGFGWAKPVPINPNNFKHRRFGLICVAFAGCCVNIIIATLAIFLWQFFAFSRSNFFFELFKGILKVVAEINIILGALNLIPIPPLDGSKIIMGFFPEDAQRKLARYEPFGLVILFILLSIHLLDPVIDSFYEMIKLLIVSVLRLFG